MNIPELYELFKQHPQVSTDTRTIDPGCIFFALKGANFNGNLYASDAIEKGAAYAVIDEAAYKGEQCILVDDVLECLQRLAWHHRQHFGSGFPVIGITGSNGKTTTKELMHAVLNSTYPTYATKGNLNNHIGVPLTLLEIDPNQHHMAIVEMGANHPGNIKELCEIADPDIGLITNIGKAHIEGFGSFEGVIKTKKELYDHLRAAECPIFINRDNELLMGISEGMQTIQYSTSDDPESEAVVRGVVAELNPFLAVKWSLDGSNYQVQTRLVGSYNLENVLAAIAVGNHFGVKPEAINAALEAYTPTNNRSQVQKTANNTLIMDAYNANPTSMTAAIHNFNSIPADKKYFILGDMLELGQESETEHQTTCDLLDSLGLHNGILVGKEFSKANTALKQFENTDDALSYITIHPPKGCLVLIKGSRGIRLEKTVPLL